MYYLEGMLFIWTVSKICRPISSSRMLILERINHYHTENDHEWINNNKALKLVKERWSEDLDMNGFVETGEIVINVHSTTHSV